MIFSAVILILAYIFIATEKIPKVTIALIGAALTMFLGLVSVNKNLSDGSLDPHYFVNFIADILKVSANDILDFDLYVYNSEQGCFTGMKDEFISCPRLDNLTSCLALINAVINGRRSSGNRPDRTQQRCPACQPASRPADFILFHSFTIEIFQAAAFDYFF